MESREVAMKVVEFEGTPEEYAQFLAIRGQPRSGEAEQHPVDEVAEKGADRSTALVRFLQDVLNRRELGENYKQLLASLYEAGDAGLLRRDLVQKLGLSDSQLSGILGALGRRIEATPGVDTAGRPGRTGTGHMMESDKVGGIWRYRLIPEAREAIEKEDSTLHILSRP
ncbi:MAG: hypothetical protein ACOYEW_00460 [Anaerolineae bacterium]|jgi:hypothetical protein